MKAEYYELLGAVLTLFLAVLRVCRPCGLQASHPKPLEAGWGTHRVKYVPRPA